MICDFIKNTPNLKLLNYKTNEIYAKIEGVNPFGSVKDRSAYYAIKKLLDDSIINKNTTIIESTSGNMGVALAGVCKLFGLKFIAVIDPAISPVNEFLIKSLGAETIKVVDSDENNSYLKARLKKVKQIFSIYENIYWFNQYGNPLIREAFKNTLGEEIVRDNPNMDYLFMAVSSLGTITGVSERVKEFNSNIKVVAVDILGSKIFDKNTKCHKHLSGIGSSIQTEHLAHCKLDDHILVDEASSIAECKNLLFECGAFVGGSSGCVVSGIKKYIDEHNLKNKKIVCVFPDNGYKYLETIYNEKWYKENIEN